VQSPAAIHPPVRPISILHPIAPRLQEAYGVNGMESSAKQATVGKMALGIYVTDLNGDRMSFAPPTV
jgi:uncharacterized RDD family membrane protein YckC